MTRMAQGGGANTVPVSCSKACVLIESIIDSIHLSILESHQLLGNLASICTRCRSWESDCE